MQNIPIIIDIEASGFGSSSYPVEVGVITDTGEKYCRLILPQNDWLHWSAEAENLHGISRDTLVSKGKNPIQICLELNQLLKGKTIYSDGWAVDNAWMIKLFASARVEMQFYLSPLEVILSEKQIEIWDRTKTALIQKFNTTRHRASVDAELIQRVFVSTKNKEKDERAH